MIDEKPKCFIIMPITTDTKLLDYYLGDQKHFNNVLNHLFFPAVENAGFEAISPKADGSNLIHADIIKQLSQTDLVLCDMSGLNPNVFFEFGIRTALNKPVALVVDDVTSENVPFDTHIINYHVYKSSPTWENDEEITKLTAHIQKSSEKSNDQNSLWKYFGVTQTGTYNPENATIGDKIDLLIKEVMLLRKGSLNDRKGNIEIDFQLEMTSLEAEYEFKKQEAIRIRDALTLRRLEREFDRKVELAKAKRDLELARLSLV